MKNFIFILLCAAFVGCKSSIKIPEGAPEKIRIKTLRENVKEAENNFTSIGIRLNGNFKDASTNQGFRATINLLPDSLIWIDVADPILGLKVARAVIYKDSVAFINRLQKEYYTGSLTKLQEKLQMDYGFELLQSILGANLAFDINEEYILSYLPNYYLLTDHKVKDNGEALPVVGQRELHQITIDPRNYKPHRQILDERSKNEKYELLYVNLQQYGEFFYPEKIVLKVIQKEESTVELDIKDVKFNQDFNYSFTIPSGYVQMR